MIATFQFIGLWLVAFLCALCESALRYASRARLEETVDDPGRSEELIDCLERSRSMDDVCVITRVCASVAFVLLAAARAGGESWLVPGLVAAAVLFGAAELPGRWAGRRWSSYVLAVFLPPLWYASFVVEPFRALRHGGEEEDQEEPPEDTVAAAEEEILVAIEDGTEEGALEADEKQMIKGILQFRDVQVGQILTPRTEMECLEVNTPLDEAVEQIKGFVHSRIPIYEETRDVVAGIVYVKDLLPALTPGREADVELKDIMREPYFVPETKRAGELLRQFQERHIQIAMVVDEYGGVNGLVTVEDVTEEIVGEIEDEYDQENQEERIKRLSPTRLEVDARVQIHEINEMLDVQLPEDEDYDTLGGFVMTRCARVPAPGETVTSDGLRVKTLQSDDRQVKRLLLELEKPQAGDAADE